MAAMWRGTLRERMDRNLAALESVAHELTPEAVEMLRRVRQLRLQGPAGRVLALRRGGFYRQTSAGNVGLTMAALFNRL